MAIHSTKMSPVSTIDLETRAKAMRGVSKNDREAVIDYLSRYDSDGDHKLCPGELAVNGGSLTLGQQMDRFHERFDDYYLNFHEGRVMSASEGPEKIELARFVDETEYDAWWLLGAMADERELSDSARILSGEPMNCLARAIEVYKNAGGIYDFRVPLRGLHGYVSEHPERAHDVLSELYYAPYRDLIGPDVPEGDRTAFGAVEAAVDERRVDNCLAFLGLYILTAAWENGLEDRIQE